MISEQTLRALRSQTRTGTQWISTADLIDLLDEVEMWRTAANRPRKRKKS